MTTDTQATQTYCKRHPETTSRLRCSTCEELICPQCMVMCDVGIKCPACIKQTKSHITQLGKNHVVTACIVSAVLGHGFGWLHPVFVQLPFFHFFGIPVLGLILSFLSGQFAGKIIRWSVHYKTGTMLSRLTAISALVGMLASPLMVSLMEWINFVSLTMEASNVQASGTSSVFMLFHIGVQIAVMAVFIKGLQNAFKV